MRFEKIFTYIGLAAIALLLFGLGGWYLFIRGETQLINKLDAGRGFSESIPTFLGSTGSTIANIASQFGISTNANGENPSAVKPPQLWRANATPVAGMAFLKGTTTLRFVERTTGYVVDIDPNSGSIVRRTNTLNPQTYDAQVTGRGAVVLQTMTDDFKVETFIGTLSTTTIDGYAQLIGTTLIPNISSIAVAHHTNELLYSARAGSTALLIQSPISGTAPKKRLSSAVSGWNLHWLPDGTQYIVEKPGSGVVGSAFRLLANERLEPLIQSIPGLIILPQASSTALLYSADNGTSVDLFLKPEADATIAALPLNTPASKCVWIPNTITTAWCAVSKDTLEPNFLDTWYRGITHTSDNWWKIEGGAGKTEEIFRMNETEPIEVTNPIIDESGAYIAFINGWDKSLWILRRAE